MYITTQDKLLFIVSVLKYDWLSCFTKLVTTPWSMSESHEATSAVALRYYCMGLLIDFSTYCTRKVAINKHTKNWKVRFTIIGQSYSSQKSICLNTRNSQSISIRCHNFYYLGSEYMNRSCSTKESAELLYS